MVHIFKLYFINIYNQILQHGDTNTVEEVVIMLIPGLDLIRLLSMSFK